MRWNDNRLCMDKSKRPGNIYIRHSQCSHNNIKQSCTGNVCIQVNSNR